MSLKPIQDYYDCLKVFAERSYDKIDKDSGFDLNRVSALIDQGCLSGLDTNTLNGRSYLNVSITPHGAVVLAEWSSILRNNSFHGQFMDALGKIVWLVAGMVITVAGAVLNKIIQ